MVDGRAEAVDQALLGRTWSQVVAVVSKVDGSPASRGGVEGDEEKHEVLGRLEHTIEQGGASMARQGRGRRGDDQIRVASLPARNLAAAGSRRRERRKEGR